MSRVPEVGRAQGYVVHKPKRPNRPAVKSDIVRIEMIDAPETLTKGEGFYEVRYMDEKFYVDVIDCKKEIEKYFPGMGTQLIDRIQNFRKLFMNITTGEIST